MSRPTLREVIDSLAPERAANYKRISGKVAETVIEKQVAYGDSFGKSGIVMAALYPDGVPPSKLADALTVTRIVDKLFRIATARDALGESPWLDIQGYALLAQERIERERAALENAQVDALTKG